MMLVCTETFLLIFAYNYLGWGRQTVLTNVEQTAGGGGAASLTPRPYFQK